MLTEAAPASALALSVLLLAAPAGAAGAAVPGEGAQPVLSVELTDGVTDAAPGDELEYVATVRNDGADVFTGTIRIEAPAFVELAAADADVAGPTAAWPVELEPGASRSVTATALVGDIPGDDYQVVTLATVHGADGREVLVRAADADSIPGAAAPEPVPGLVDEAAATTPAWLLPTLVGAGVVLAGILAAVLLLARRRAER